MRYQVKVRGSSHYVIGLPEGQGEAFNDSMLIYYYNSGDIDTKMTDAHMMLSALYDLYQCNDKIIEHDVFETEFGDYQCVGVHVVPNFTLPEKVKKSSTGHYTSDGFPILEES